MKLIRLAPGATRGDCQDQPRPCGFACRYRLDGGTCALDYADEGGMTLEQIGAVMGVTRERVRQIEAQALSQLARIAAREGLER